MPNLTLLIGGNSIAATSSFSVRHTSHFLSLLLPLTLRIYPEAQQQSRGSTGFEQLRWQEGYVADSEIYSARRLRCDQIPLSPLPATTEVPRSHLCCRRLRRSI